MAAYDKKLRRDGEKTESAWNEIYHSRDWPTWWKSVEVVLEVRKGDESSVGSIHRYTWKSKLPTN